MMWPYRIIQTVDLDTGKRAIAIHEATGDAYAMADITLRNHKSGIPVPQLNQPVISKREARAAVHRSHDTLRMYQANGVLRYPLTMQDGSKFWMSCRDTTQGRIFVEWINEHDSYNWQGRWRWLRRFVAAYRTWVQSHWCEAA